ncbi:prostate and testis expressed protein 4 [Antechinus flavipes]|uniref:prostate and testis expressed protein 4 n=1 Tax=Antechinus flavipes TaxID=38775 RepID=UPI0022364376|nr:prostate and testis expressed protein 4 [Antechinus flavipes]
MDKLLLGLSLLCFTWTVSGGWCINCRKKSVKIYASQKLLCRSCDFVLPKGDCIKGRGTCTAKINETCSTEKVFYNGLIQYGKLKCKEHCQESKTMLKKKMISSECCMGRNFCNNI